MALSGRRCCCACPSLCARTLLCAAPLGEHIPESSFTPSTRAALGAPLLQEQGRKTPLTCPPGDVQPAERVTGEEAKQWGGHPLREKSPCTIGNILFLTAREILTFIFGTGAK